MVRRCAEEKVTDNNFDARNEDGSLPGAGKGNEEEITKAMERKRATTEHMEVVLNGRRTSSAEHACRFKHDVNKKRNKKKDPDLLDYHFKSNALRNPNAIMEHNRMLTQQIPKWMQLGEKKRRIHEYSSTQAQRED